MYYYAIHKWEPKEVEIVKRTSKEPSTGRFKTVWKGESVVEARKFLKELAKGKQSKRF